MRVWIYGVCIVIACSALSGIVTIEGWKQAMLSTHPQATFGDIVIYTQLQTICLCVAVSTIGWPIWKYFHRPIAESEL